MEQELKNCPKCKSENVETHQDSVDIGVGVQYGPLHWMCHECGADETNYCTMHSRSFGPIEDRQEHFAEEHADPHGCPLCYCNSLMEL